MNSLERTNAALMMQTYDHVSPQPQIDMAYAAKLSGIEVGRAFIDEKLHAKALNHVFEVHDVDGIYINLCLSQGAIREIKEEDGTIHVVDDCDATWAVAVDDIGAVVRRDISSLDDERLKTLNPDIFGAKAVFELIDDKWKREKAIITGVTGAFSHVVFLYDVEKTMMALIMEPDKLKEVLEVRCDLAIEKIDELADLGCKHMWIGEGAASGSLISPDHYREFVLPYQKRMAEHMRRRGIHSVVHICGNINKALADVSTCGADALDLDHLNDLETSKKVVNGVMCIKGNIDPVALQNMTKEQVSQMVSEKIALFPEGKGLIMSTGCLVTRDTPSENIDAIVKACRESQ